MTPAWVAIADLGSGASAAAELRQLARRFAVCYLRIDYAGPWNQALAFNTALRHLPAATHVVQLDADMVLHPNLLRLAAEVLARRDAFALVASYLPADAPKLEESAFDATTTSDTFFALSASAEGGHPYSRGGFVAMSRESLIEHRGYDAAYVGWGFEDADLWWRMGTSGSQYCESSGSFLVHRFHPRQPAVTDPATANRTRYARRLRDPALPVNPLGWGAASVIATDFRPGIISVSSPTRSVPVQTAIRRYRAGRLMARGNAFRTAGLGSAGTAPSRQCRARPFHVAILIDDWDTSLLATALAALAAQSLRPRDIVVMDGSRTATRSQDAHAAMRAAPGTRYVRTAGKTAEAIHAVLQRARADAASLLVMHRAQWFAPHALDWLDAALGDGHSFLYGVPHALPPVARDLDILSVFDWNEWASVAAIEESSAHWWHAGGADWMTRHGLYDERVPDDRCIPEAVRRAGRAGGRAVAAWPNQRVIGLVVAPPASREPPPGTEEAVLAREIGARFQEMAR